MQQVNAWKKRFIDKFWEFNFLQIKDLGDFDINFLAENLLSGGFLGEKKLIIVNLWDLSKDSINEQQSTFLLANLDKIPDGNIVVFYAVGPDKRTKAFKEIKKHTEFKEFNISDDDIKPLFNKRYAGKIDSAALDLLIRYKSSNVVKIESEIEKLLIHSDFIDKSLVQENIFPELEESIFILIDDILNKNLVAAIKRLDMILNDTSPYAFYNNLLANIRTTVYIYKLKSMKMSSSEIGNTLALWNRAFLVNKSYKITPNELKNFYFNLVWLDKKMKSGKFLDSDEESFVHELQRLIMSI